MARIEFRPVELSDCEKVQAFVYSTECRNCDLNFMNLISWRFLFETELAFHNGWLLFRFKAAGHLAYLLPLGEGDWTGILLELAADASACGEKFRLMGVCEHSLERLHKAMPGCFSSSTDRSYSDYLYSRESLISLAGKKLQSKRNHINRFEKLYPQYEFLPLSSCFFDECLALVEKWHGHKDSVAIGKLLLEDELSALRNTFEHWDVLCGHGLLLRVENQIVAFTYGAPINYDTFDVCVEKADVEYDGAFAMINRAFVRSLPEKYIYINREEDLGIEGLRKAKLSYQPMWLLHKYTVEAKEKGIF